jgi:hypothetical protein
MPQRLLTSLLAATFLASLLAFATGCDTFEGSNPQETTSRVFVANQGTPSSSNGSITVYEPGNQRVNSQALGNLNSRLQSITIFGRRLYASATSAGRVDVFDTDSLKQVTQVTGLTAPSYVALTDRGTGIVSDPAPDTSVVRFVNFESAMPSISDSLVVPGTPAAIALTEDRFYVALGGARDTNLVAAVNRSPLERTVLNLGCVVRSVLADNQDDVYAVCSNRPEVLRLEGSSGDVLGRISLPETPSTLGDGQTAAFAEQADELYVVLGDRRVARIDTRAEEVDAVIGPVAGEEGISAVAYDGTSEQLYLGRMLPPPEGFDQQGRVTVHDRSGDQLSSFPAGIAPTHVAFRRVTVRR